MCGDTEYNNRIDGETDIDIQEDEFCFTQMLL